MGDGALKYCMTRHHIGWLWTIMTHHWLRKKFNLSVKLNKDVSRRSELAAK